MAPGQQHYDALIKLLLIGDSGVGKSCLLLRFADEYVFRLLWPDTSAYGHVLVTVPGLPGELGRTIFREK